MSEFCKHNTHESHYCGDCHTEQREKAEALMEKLVGALRQAIGTHGEPCKERSECDCVKYCLSVLEEYMKYKAGK